MNEEKIITMLAKDDEITWQAIIKELVRSEQMDPWDINVSILSKKYIDMIKKMKDCDLRISGKVLLAATMMLKIKSSRLIGEDLDKLDSMFAYTQEPDYDLDFFSDFGNIYDKPQKEKEHFKLIPRTPQPRKRKVSIFDLMNALQKAMEVKKRRVFRDIPDEIKMHMPQKKKDISNIIREVFDKVKIFFLSGNKKMTFTQLLPDEANKEDKVYTFIPLLHLSNQRKIDLEQKDHFGEIHIQFPKKT
ncbi:segregation/condensation protein A [Candidatus Woesearchaeota archaeon]|nr:segregation/condensation protein A [Candidatus Woesearchaeota archaeon]